LLKNANESSSTADDDQGHGSHVAGIAAAKDNELGVVGMAPHARVWAVKVRDADGACKVSDQIKGMDYIIKHADEIDVLNLSLENPNSPALNKMINNAIEAGITVIAAAGNYGKDANATTLANNLNALAVSAIGDSDGKCGGLGPVLPQFDGNVTDDTMASFSNFGPVVKIAIPGVNIFSAYIGTGYAIESGTSMAAPHVTGAAALYKAMFPDATLAEVSAEIMTASTQPDTPCDGGSRGYFTGDKDIKRSHCCSRAYFPPRMVWKDDKRLKNTFYTITIR
jgi:subtilisin family serine protease